MARMKKFLLYFVMFAGLFLFVELFTNVDILNTEEKYAQLKNYEIKTDSPKIEVTDFMGNNSSGYIKGNITNNTGEHIKDKYLKFGFYNKSNDLIAAKYQEIKYFNVDEKINFNIDFNYKDIQKVQIELVNEIEKVGMNNIKSNENNYSKEESAINDINSINIINGMTRMNDIDSINNINTTNGIKIVEPIITEDTLKIALPIASVLGAIYTCNIFAL